MLLDSLDIPKEEVKALKEIESLLKRRFKLINDETWEDLTQLPKSIGNLISLEELSIMGNNLTKPPENLSKLRNLRVYLEII